MTTKIAIPLVLGCLLAGTVACDGDDKTTAKNPPSTPPASTPTLDTTTPTTPPTTTPPPEATATPRTTPTEPKISKSKEVVLIDPDGKRYTFRMMVQLAAGMRATMGKNAPSGFCAESYRKGVAEGGKFPAGREVFMTACQEGWKLGARPPG